MSESDKDQVNPMDGADPTAFSQDQSRPEAPPHGWLHGFLLQDRFALTLGSIIGLIVTMWLARTMHFPAVPYRAGAILQQSGWPIVIGLVWVAIALSAAAASIIASRNHYDGGLFCAAIALAGLSSKFGTVRYALLASSGASVYLLFAVELLLLSVPLALVWLVLFKLSRAGTIAPELVLDDTGVDEPLDQKLLATAGQALVMIILMMFICQTDVKKQTLASVAISAYFGALASYHFVATRPSIWYFAGPILVGLIGYIGQYFNATDWMIGESRGFFAPLARPLPLDYASLGVAGAMLGYWTAQVWHQQRLEIDPDAA